MTNDQGKYARIIDFVICVDGSANMKPFVAQLDRVARELHSILTENSWNFDPKEILTRAKFIVFRDYGRDGNDAMVQSRFFELPNELDSFVKYAQSITAFGGGNSANGYEALWLALQSDFVATRRQDKQAIMLISCNDAFGPGKRSGAPNYPKDIPNLASLAEFWYKSPYFRNRRFLLAAPNDTFYRKMRDSMAHTVYDNTVELNSGAKDLDWHELIRWLFVGTDAEDD